MRTFERTPGLVAVTCLALALSACGSIPHRTPPAAVEALPPATTGVLNEVSAQVAGELAPGESAFLLLDRADLSLDARLALVDQAVVSLDFQYFIVEKDPSSRMFTERLWQAAERGVRVRILLDDMTMQGKDGEFAALSRHPNISARTFNPWHTRKKLPRIGEFFSRIGRLNHRMHNKTLIADGHFAILGGRNIGDRYFGLWEDFVQNDLDIMAAGPAAGDVAASFDLYWDHALSYDVMDIVKPKEAGGEPGPTVDYLRSVYLAEAEKLQEFPLERAGWEEFFEFFLDNYSAGIGRLELDQPDVYVTRPIQLYAPILDMLRQAEQRVLLCTAYFVPSQDFVDLLAELVERGVEVTVLTNSLASNNHMVAHMAFKPWRRDLLDIGVDVYESRADSAFITEYSTPPVEPGFLGLHSKAIVVDDHLSFVGSPNIDPRSLLINTEIGFFVESEELAGKLAALIERDISPDAAWHLYYDDKKRLRWSSSAGVLKNQPAQGVMQRVTAFFIGILPLRGQA